MRILIGVAGVVFFVAVAAAWVRYLERFYPGPENLS